MNDIISDLTTGLATKALLAGDSGQDFAANNITVAGTVDGRDVATDGTKLDGIEANATADQSDAEIKIAYEANPDTNALTDALLNKLNAIEAGATADQTKADIDALNIDADTLDGIDSTGFSLSTHNHSGVYEPADATILKDADIGSTVQQHMTVVSTAEAEAGSATIERSWTALRVRQAIDVGSARSLTANGYFKLPTWLGGAMGS